MRRFATVLYTGNGSCFIILDDIPRDKIEQLGDDFTVRISSRKIASLHSSIVLTVQLWNSVKKVRLFITDKRATAVILAGDY